MSPLPPRTSAFFGFAGWSLDLNSWKPLVGAVLVGVDASVLRRLSISSGSNRESPSSTRAPDAVPRSASVVDGACVFFFVELFFFACRLLNGLIDLA